MPIDCDIDISYIFLTFTNVKVINKLKIIFHTFSKRYYAGTH